ncbi:MAG: hypothetical protein K0Q72_2281, partial [Armatimonadetes bacterium]|nr:hypothetical protein [Armatimonadota bacterium]
NDGTIGPEEAPHISIRILGEATPDRSPRPARTGGTPKAAIRLTIAPGALRPETLPAPARPPSDAPGRAPGGLD